MRRFYFSAVLGPMFAFMAATPAVACPDGYYNTAFGVCLPNSGTVTETITKPATETAAVSGGLVLEQWIVNSRNSAIGSSAPIPAQIRYQLEPFFGPDILDRVRYKIGDSGFFNAGRNILFNGSVAAVTLNDLVVFRDFNDSQSNVELWAHELVHVRQYRDWGTRDFAIRYVRNYNSIEDEAFAIQGQVAATPVRSVPNAPYPNQTYNPPPSPPVPMIPVRFCQTPVATCPMQPVFIPMGSPCECIFPNGQRAAGSAF